MSATNLRDGASGKEKCRITKHQLLAPMHHPG